MCQNVRSRNPSLAYGDECNRHDTWIMMVTQQGFGIQFLFISKPFAHIGYGLRVWSQFTYSVNHATLALVAVLGGVIWVNLLGAVARATSRASLSPKVKDM